LYPKFGISKISRENEMKDFKLEYRDGQLITLDIDGINQLGRAVTGITFSHELNSAPKLTLTTSENIAAPDSPASEEKSGELLPAEPVISNQPSRTRNRRRHHRSQNVQP